MTKEKTRLHPEQLKLYNSPLYRHKIKRMVESIKTLRNIPWGSKLPGKLNVLSVNATEKERDNRAKAYATRAEQETAHYWAQTIEASFERRIQSASNDKEE